MWDILVLLTKFCMLLNLWRCGKIPIYYARKTTNRKPKTTLRSNCSLLPLPRNKTHLQSIACFCDFGLYLDVPLCYKRKNGIRLQNNVTIISCCEMSYYFVVYTIFFWKIRRKKNLYQWKRFDTYIYKQNRCNEVYMESTLFFFEVLFGICLVLR